MPNKPEESHVDAVESKTGYVTAHEGIPAHPLAPPDERGAFQANLDTLEGRVVALEDAFHTDHILGAPRGEASPPLECTPEELMQIQLDDLASRVAALEQIVKLDAKLGGKDSVLELSDLMMARVLSHLKLSLGHSGMPSVG